MTVGYGYLMKSLYTGKKKTIQVNNNNLPGYINTLRYFPDGVKNCYTLYPDPQYKFIFRAGFYYGNYDGLSKPPTFDILLDDHFWATVNTSSSDDQPIYHEIFYKPKADRDNTNVCLVQTRQGEVPFISSLEVAYLFIEYELNTPIMYSLMGNDTALNLVSRNAFGGLNKVLDNGESNYNSSLGVCYDITFRVWQPKPVVGYLNISYSDVDENTCLNEAYENQPPDALLKNAISPKNATDSIYLNVDFKNSTQQSAYFVFYFLDYNLSRNPNYTRKFEIHIDGAFKNVVELNNSQFGQVVSLFPVQVSGTANVTISPFSGSKFPPILNGMEVYTAMKMGSNNNVNVKVY
ncbi:probable LRR receptor-like serine/threonine-protein kinase At4g29180 [Pistacia vera]|uniref:probable LRR receptor-like serine/threonine-protein kinase At4g29180 n=1 Tax=Pistacia vera TaxID=55513 RepID=UPI0012631FB2|nr:probable LRR receptor-like serine/threonine-protein kinase At4g29180 [Pistacia vera]